MTEPPKVAVCMPYYKWVEGITALCLAGLAARSAAECRMLFIECKGCYVEDNRNGAVQYAKNTGIGFDYLLWVDGDMQFPADALVRMIAHNKAIVGANYRQRTPPYKSAGHYIDNDDSHLRDPGLWPMGHLPTGLLLTRFEIYEKLQYPWFKPGLNTEMRDDVYFCHYARENGYEVWCDHDLTKEVVHMGEQQLPWFSPEQIRPQIVRGSQIDNIESGKQAAKRAQVSKMFFETETSSEQEDAAHDRAMEAYHARMKPIREAEKKQAAEMQGKEFNRQHD